MAHGPDAAALLKMSMACKTACKSVSHVWDVIKQRYISEQPCFDLLPLALFVTAHWLGLWEYLQSSFYERCLSVVWVMMLACHEPGQTFLPPSASLYLQTGTFSSSAYWLMSHVTLFSCYVRFSKSCFTQWMCCNVFLHHICCVSCHWILFSSVWKVHF